MSDSHPNRTVAIAGDGYFAGRLGSNPIIHVAIHVSTLMQACSEARQHLSRILTQWQTKRLMKLRWQSPRMRFLWKASGSG
jgi:hypothetical protein